MQIRQADQVAQLLFGGGVAHDVDAETNTTVIDDIFGLRLGKDIYVVSSSRDVKKMEVQTGSCLFGSHCFITAGVVETDHQQRSSTDALWSRQHGDAIELDINPEHMVHHSLSFRF